VAIPAYPCRQPFPGRNASGERHIRGIYGVGLWTREPDAVGDVMPLAQEPGLLPPREAAGHHQPVAVVRSPWIRRSIGRADAQPALRRRGVVPLWSVHGVVPTVVPTNRAKPRPPQGYCQFLAGAGDLLQTTTPDPESWPGRSSIVSPGRGLSARSLFLPPRPRDRRAPESARRTFSVRLLCIHQWCRFVPTNGLCGLMQFRLLATRRARGASGRSSRAGAAIGGAACLICSVGF
jgi:hypothetical protein